jgi:hypothetical protein
MRQPITVEAGAIYGALTVIGPAPKRAGDPKKRVLCRCECGGECDPRESDLQAGKKTSCGCRIHAARRSSETLLTVDGAKRSQKAQHAGRARWGQSKPSAGPQGTEVLNGGASSKEMGRGDAPE